MDDKVKSIAYARKIRQEKIKPGYKILSHPLKSEIDKLLREGMPVIEITAMMKEKDPEHSFNKDTLHQYKRNFFDPLYKKAAQAIIKSGIDEACVKGLTVKRTDLNYSEKEELLDVDNKNFILDTKKEALDYLDFAKEKAKFTDKIGWGAEWREAINLYCKLKKALEDETDIASIQYNLNKYGQAISKTIKEYIEPEKINEFLEALQKNYKELLNENDDGGIINAFSS